MADRLHVVMVAGEAVPYAKVGGLGDVIGALPPELEKLDASVSIILPRYRLIDLNKFGFQPYPSKVEHRIPFGTEVLSFDVCAAVLPYSSVRVFLIGNDRFFDRGGIYFDTTTGKDYPDSVDRWIFFQRAALDFIRTDLPSVDIIHCHDHQTGLIPAYVRRVYRQDPAFSRTKTVFTIHNLGYQGLFPPEVMLRTAFHPGEFFPGSPFEFYGMVNFMKVGIVDSDLVTTVSETYAREIQQSAEFGFGLEGVLRSRQKPMIGIRNGIDTDMWNPESDPLIPAHFSAGSPGNKTQNKAALLRAFGLDGSRLDRPLLAMISRIDTQKGFDLLISILDSILARDISFVLLGTGNRETEVQLQTIIDMHPDRASARFRYDNSLAHLTEAGADIFLMPSKYEPCGLNQMYSMRYGTVPVVRETGGLADTVQEFNPATGQGTGFSFREYTPEELEAAILRALHLWMDRPAWAEVMRNGMNSDFSWALSARHYIAAYRGIL